MTSRAYLAWCHAELGTFAEGMAIGEEGLRIAEAVAQPGNLMHAPHGTGMLALRKGDLPRAPPTRTGRGHLPGGGPPALFPLGGCGFGGGIHPVGRVADAVPLLTQAMEQSTARETLAYQVLCRLPLAEAHLLAGRLAEAHALAERALALARAYQNGATRRMPYTFSATLRRNAIRRSARMPKPTTSRP